MPVYAAVDIGANSVRLKISKVVRSRLVLLHEDREVTRLGESVFRTGALDPEAIAQTVKVLTRFHRAAQIYGVERVRVVATSALRDANNAAALTQWVHATTGWHVEVITGLEEGRLIHLGVVSNARISAGRILLIDLGGGSCELTVSHRGQIEHIYSLPLGAVRLTRDFLLHDPPNGLEVEQMHGLIAEEILRVRDALTSKRVNITVATSGTPAALADMWAAEQARITGQKAGTNTVPRVELLRMARRLSKLGIDQRRAVPGIGPRRAEIIIAGAAVFSELLTLLELPNFRYLPFGLRDGLLAQMVSESEQRTGLRRQIISERENSLLNLAVHYQVDMRYAERIRQHCARLFKALQPIHNLPPEYADWLNAAAMLQETGSFINRAGRHRHTWYIIARSELFGYTVRQRGIIAAIARYVGKSRPTDSSTPIRSLSPEDKIMVPRAIMLLRLARALEQGRRGAVASTRIQIKPDRVRLTLLTKPMGAELELWAVEKESAQFYQIFGKLLECSEGA